MTETAVPSPGPTVGGASLLRALGPGIATAMVVGTVVGSGIFLKPGAIAHEAGRFELIIGAWIVGGFVCALGGLCLAELAAMLPQAGGIYVYLREAYGRSVAFLSGWSEFLFVRPAGIGALSVAFVGSLATALGWEIDTLSDQVTATVLALALIAMTGWVNVVGVIWGGRLQALTTVIKAVFLGALALLPLILLGVGFTAIEPGTFRSTIEPAQSTVTTQFAAALLAVMWAYNGWFAVTPVAEEVRNPNRNIPLAFFVGIGLVTLLYVSANFAYHGVLTMSEMAEAGEAVPQVMIAKLLISTSESTARIGVGAISAVIMCSIFGTINASMLNGPRITFAMGRDGLFIRALAWVHSDYRTPVVAIAVQALMSALLLIGSAVLVETVDSLRDRSVFGMLTDYIVFSVGIFLSLAVLAVIVLRLKHPEWRRPYRTLGYPVVPLLYIAFYGWFLSQIYTAKPFEALVGVGLIALGLPVYIGRKVWAARAAGPIAPSA